PAPPAQTRSELLMRWRLPTFSATNLLLPVVLFSFFGLPFAGRTTAHGLDIGVILLTSFSAYAVGQVMGVRFVGRAVAGRTTAHGLDIGVILLTSFSAYAVGQVMVYGFGIGVAIERRQGIDGVLRGPGRATPLPPGVYLAAKVIVAMLFALLAVVVLFTYAGVVGGIRVPPATWASVSARLLAGSRA